MSNTDKIHESQIAAYIGTLVLKNSALSAKLAAALAEIAALKAEMQKLKGQDSNQ